jgi:hypothetical protein
VGTPIPADKRLTFAAKLFDVLDVDGDRLMDAQCLQVRRRHTAPQHPRALICAFATRVGMQVALRVLALPHRPKEVLKRFGSADGGLLMEVRELCAEMRCACHHAAQCTLKQRRRIAGVVLSWRTNRTS